MLRSTLLVAFTSIFVCGYGPSTAKAQTLGEEFGEVISEYGNIDDDDMVFDSSASSSAGSYAPYLYFGYDYLKPSNGLFNSVANSGSTYQIGFYVPIKLGAGHHPDEDSSSWFLSSGSSCPGCDGWEIGMTASYNYTNFDMKNDVDFNVLGGNNYQLQTMRQNVFRGGLRFGRGIPLGGESSDNELMFDLTPTIHVGRIHGNFDVSPFVAGNKQIFADQDPNRNDKELIFGGGMRMGVGMRTGVGLLRLNYGIDRSNTRFGTGSRKYNTMMSYGLQMDIDTEALAAMLDGK